MFQKGDEKMRLWHKDLILVLPRQQLLGQWRECCAIAKSISTNGTPNHILVNKIMDYSMSHFYTYGKLVHRIMKLRGYKCNFDKFGHYFTYPHETEEIDHNKLFQNWHNKRYLQQCYYNLEEKYDCGGITEDEWKKIKSEMNPRLFW